MKWKILTTSMLLIFAAPAMAGGGFDYYDKNADGYITADELGEEKAHKIAKMDTDGDEMVSKAEYQAYKEAKMKKDKTS